MRVKDNCETDKNSVSNWVQWQICAAVLQHLTDHGDEATDHFNHRMKREG